MKKSSVKQAKILLWYLKILLEVLLKNSNFIAAICLFKYLSPEAKNNQTGVAKLKGTKRHCLKYWLNKSYYEANFIMVLDLNLIKLFSLVAKNRETLFLKENF